MYLLLVITLQCILQLLLAVLNISLTDIHTVQEHNLT